MNHRRRPDADQAFGTTPAPHAREAFAGGALPWWAGTPIRLVVILALLGGLIFVLNAQRRAGAFYSDQPRSAAARRYCTSVLPALEQIPAAQFQKLSAGLVAVVSEVGGRAYETGGVPANTIWSDDGPDEDQSQVKPAHGLLPAGYEMRRSASDPQWGASYRDDIVGDVFLFAEPRQAGRFFKEASDVRCHRAARALSASRPTGARNLIWVNPDDVTQEDALLLLGHRVYRISDVRPQKAGVGPSPAEQDEGILTVDAVACVIPGAICPRTTAGE